MSWLAITIVGLVVLLIAGIAWVGRKELRQILSQLKTLGVVFLTIGSIFWTIWCYTYLIRWKVRFLLRNFAGRTAIGVLLLASFYVLLELIVALGRHVLGASPDLEARLIAFPEVPTPPLLVDAGLLVLAVLVVRHHWHEWKINMRQSEVPRALEELLLEFENFRKVNPNPDSTVKQEFLDVLMKRFKIILEVGNKRRVAITLMELIGGNGNILGVTFIHPQDAQLDKDLKLEVGQGAAGKAYEKKQPIYIPSVRHLVGINVQTKESEGVRFKKSPKKEQFRSILCVPVMTRSEILGVLSFSSAKRATFFPVDFEIASLAAAFVSIFY